MKIKIRAIATTLAAVVLILIAACTNEPTPTRDLSFLPNLTEPTAQVDNGPEPARAEPAQPGPSPASASSLPEPSPTFKVPPAPTSVYPPPTKVPLAFSQDTRLHQAAFKEDRQAVEALLVQGEYVNYPATLSIEGLPGALRQVTPLHMAAWNNTVEVVELLLNWEADLEAVGFSYNGREDIPRPHYMPKYGLTPLYFAAAFNDDPRVMELLLKRGASLEWVPKNGQTALEYAAHYNRNPAIPTILLNYGADLHIQESRKTIPLEMAARYNTNPEMVAILLEHEGRLPRYSEDADTALHGAAALNPDPGVVTLLLDSGFDVNRPGDAGHTPLHKSTWNKDSAEISRILIDRGADIEAKSAGGKTPLFVALLRQNVEVAAMLLERGAQTQVVDSGGNFPLAQAVYATNGSYTSEETKATIELLIQHGANIEQRSPDGQTALHKATIRNVVLMKLLLDMGANPNAKDKNNKTPCQLARESKYHLADLDEVCPP